MSGTRSPSRPPNRPAQRWPDVMIGVITLALLGGFGTLLLGQRKPAEVAKPPATTAAIPASPGTVPEPAKVTPQPAPVAQTPATPAPATQTPVATATTPAPAATQPATTTPATQTLATQTPAPATTATTPATQTPAEQPLAQTSEIPPAPKAAPVQPITPPVLPKPAPAPVATAPAPTTTAPATAAQTPTTQTPTAQTPAIPATPAVPPRAAGAVATSENRTPLRSDYRISLGSFSTRGTVGSQTATVSALGYRVHAIDLGDQYVAQVGPFADEASARQALADIQRAYPNALLYRPRAKASETASTGDSATQAASSTSSSTSSTATAAATSAAPAASRPAPSGPTYLQVGAFDRVESAQNLVGILKDNGFAPTVNNPPDRKTTVMVGPYSGDALLRAETRLNNAGLDHFRVR